MNASSCVQYRKGLSDGFPIGLGYLSVSFSFGIAAVNMGIPVWAAIAISMTNLTSAGQFAGIGLIASGAGLYELALTQLVINLRYALMSLSLSQKLDGSVGRLHRFLLAFGNTDEIFAVASARQGLLRKSYLYGLMTLPYAGWTLGTILGAAASGLLPAFLGTALSTAIYGMFLAIVLPAAKKERPVLLVALTAAALSGIFQWAPWVKEAVSSGFSIIICTVAAAALGAFIAPVKEEEG